jgi:cell wall-associated NlpC family hydrolase
VALTFGPLAVPGTGTGQAGAVGTDPGVTTAESQAAQTATAIAETGQQIDALSQQYDLATLRTAQLDVELDQTRERISGTDQQVGHEQDLLRSEALSQYLNDTAAGQVPALFGGADGATGVRQVYSDLVAADVESTLAALRRSQDQLRSQQSVLGTEEHEAEDFAALAGAARAQATAELAQQQTVLSEQTATVQGLLVAQQAGYAQSQRGLGLQVSGTAPPAGPAGARAVYWAETQLGVDYQWGAEEPGVGFDCSGLTSWAWGMAGASLEHYSGSQFQETEPVPLSDLQPGDLLFYGPGGSEHVAMYVGGGDMIEAPRTGETVWITPLRTGDGFAGAGRPS